MRLLGFVIGSAVMLASTAFAAEYNLKLAHEVAVESTQHLAATRFAELVKERTNGAVEIKVYPNSTLGPGQQALNLMRGGSIEIIQSGSTTFNGLVGETAALEMPFVFEIRSMPTACSTARSARACSTSWTRSGSRGSPSSRTAGAR